MKYLIALIVAATCAIASTGCTTSEPGPAVTSSSTTYPSVVRSSSVSSAPADTPNTTVSTTTMTTTIDTPPPPPTGPAIGAPCIGADIGRRTTEANGTPIICDDYVWVLDKGQVARHPWADDQTAWENCIKTRSVEECRAILNGETRITTTATPAP
ncbi:hypothetical protein GTV32_14510 [Gordonia sp. SID5947]|uniref:hypothetical protein n=1 Tax=Gordonia sp. SID5947 TaxID=2690315 RepID=UPI0013710DD4|nr:hypothetical protein [Gordonia sp. SID5947]MYR07442.1 hypothetical protein [Gordonia sp. SID5947]